MIYYYAPPITYYAPPERIFSRDYEYSWEYGRCFKILKYHCVLHIMDKVNKVIINQIMQYITIVYVCPWKITGFDEILVYNVL